MPAVCLKIDEDQRPVKLRKIVLGFPCSNNQTEFKFDLTLNYKIASIIQTYSEQKPALVVQQLFINLILNCFLLKSVDSKPYFLIYSFVPQEKEYSRLLLFLQKMLNFY